MANELDQKVDMLVKGHNALEGKVVGIEARVSKAEKGLNGLAATLRTHFGDAFKNGISTTKTLAAIAVVVLGIVALVRASTVVWDVGTLASGKIGTCVVTTDGTNATLTVNKIVAAGVTNLASAMVGNLPTATMTNHVGAAIAAAPSGATVTQLIAGISGAYTNIYSSFGVLISHTP